MGYALERLEAIFSKTDGDCTYCEKQLAWSNYGLPGNRGAWQVDHSLPVSRGGTAHLNNLVAACVDCNQTKGDMTASEFRAAITPRVVEVEGPGWGQVLLWGAGLVLGAALLGRTAGNAPNPPGGNW